MVAAEGRLLEDGRLLDELPVGADGVAERLEGEEELYG